MATARKFRFKPPFEEKTLILQKKEVMELTKADKRQLKDIIRRGILRRCEAETCRWTSISPYIGRRIPSEIQQPTRHEGRAERVLKIA